MSYSTSFMARNLPNIKIYACKINRHNLNKSKKYLSKYNNVKVINVMFPKILNALLDNRVLGDKPLFF